MIQENGVAASQPGSREPGSSIPALRASIPNADDVASAARRIAKVVADRCHGDRPPGAAPERYATIFQAAWAGVVECMLPSAGTPCELCGRSVRLGHYINVYDDIGEAHVDCGTPDALPAKQTPSPADDGSVMPTYRLGGSPLILEAVPASAMSARSGETAGLAPQDASAVPDRADAQVEPKS